MRREQLIEFFDATAHDRERWIEKSRDYHDDLQAFFASHICAEDRVLEIGCGLGDLIASLPCRRAVGMDFSEVSIRTARRRHPAVTFLTGEAENLPLRGPFDKIILSDTIGLLKDVQQVFQELRHVTAPQSRILITYYNYLWEPVLKCLEWLGLKMPQPTQNWLPLEDIRNLLELTGFEVIKKGHRLLLPIKIPVLSPVVNRFLARLPFLRRLCLVEWVIAKPIAAPWRPDALTTSVVIPCRNERDNIRDAVLGAPRMGKATELIFVDGASTDGTLEEIQKMQAACPEKKIRLLHQGAPKGKADAVHKGLEAATGDIVMILDADLTVGPEDLPKFFHALVDGRGEFVNGSRLVYPMEKQAMRFLNLVGNKFFGLAFSYLLDQRFTDTLCGTKALWRSGYEKIRRGRDYFGPFDPFGDFDLLFGASRLDLKIVELPVRYRERTYGTTKISRFTHGWLLLKMCWVAMKKLKFVK